MQVASARSQVQVASAWSQVQVASARSQVQVASARSQAQLTYEESKSLLRAADSADDALRKSTLCGDWRGRGAKTRGFFCGFVLALRGRGAKAPGCLRCCLGPRDPLRGSEWSRCKNSRFFAISAVLARPSAGIGVVEVQKLEVF